MRSLPVTYSSEGWPEIPAIIGKHTVHLRLEPDSVYSMFDQWAVDPLGLRVSRLLNPSVMLGTERLDTHVTIPTMLLGNARLKDAEILVRPTHTASPSKERSIERAYVGSLGMDLLSGVDIEFDLAHDTVKLFSSEHCVGRGAYWADRYDVVPMGRGPLGDLYFVVELDGKKLQTKLGTLYPSSNLFAYVTKELYGWDENSPGVETTNTKVGTVRYRTMALTSGGLQVLNAQIILEHDPGNCIKHDRIITDREGAAGFERCRGAYPLYLGLDVLKKLRLYVATKEQKLYFTLADAHKPQAGQ